jgi:alkaline phosphatase
MMLPLRSLCRLLAALALVCLVASPSWAAKNVIVMVTDGAGYHAWMAASMYQGKLGKQLYDDPAWKHVACTTHPLTMDKWPGGKSEQSQRRVYDAAKYWATTAVEVKSGVKPFAGYNFAIGSYTDSAAAATALASGQKTYNNALNWSDEDQPVDDTLADIAKRQGKSVGAITSVQWSHATPAGLSGTRRITRSDYAAIANQMLEAGRVDVIMGAGHPEYDDDAQPRRGAISILRYRYVGGKKTWAQLKSGTHPAGWKLVESDADFEALIDGPTPAKVVGTARAAETLQYRRTRGKPVPPAKTAKSRPPFEQPLNEGVPTLKTMSLAALNCLDDNPKGFYLSIEGGAVDWANHNNDLNRMIEEQIGYLEAVEAVCQWVETKSSWDETLVILTSDHETGMIWGPKSDEVAFQPIEDRGAGKAPGVKYHSTNHSLSLVPVYARGPGSDGFAARVRGADEAAARVWKISGKYVDNTDVFGVVREALGGK